MADFLSNRVALFYNYFTGLRSLYSQAAQCCVASKSVNNFSQLFEKPTRYLTIADQNNYIFWACDLLYENFWLLWTVAWVKSKLKKYFFLIWKQNFLDFFQNISEFLWIFLGTFTIDSTHCAVQKILLNNSKRKCGLGMSQRPPK